MNGREEMDLKNKKWLEERIGSAPKPLQDYMLSFARKETSSQKVYFCYLMNFLNYISETKKIDVNDYESFKQIKKMDIDAYMNYTEISSTTGKKCGASIRNSKLSAVKSFFEFLVDNDIIIKNPCKNVCKIKEYKEKTITYLTKKEIQEVKDRILTVERSFYHEDPWKYRNYAIFVLGCTTGLRQSAIRGINVEDLDLEKAEVTVVEKGNYTRRVFLSQQACEALAKWLEVRLELLQGQQCDAVFISNRKQRITSRSLENVIKNVTKDIDKHITPHKMRSTCGMNLYAATGNMFIVAEQLGHKNINNTKIYAEATKEKMRETANLMDKIM